MRSASVVLGYTLAVLAAAAFAFVLVRSADAIDPVWNEGWQLRIDGDATPREPAAVVYREVTALADRSAVGVVRVLVDPALPTSGRSLYAAGPGTAATWLEHGYQDVDPRTTTTVAPLTELGSRDVRGEYLVGGERADAEAVLALIESAGWSGRVAPYAAAVDLDTYRDRGDLVRALVVAILAVIVLVGSGTLLRGRAHGVQRLHGAGSSSILLRELRWLALPTALWSATGLVVLGALLALHNSLAQLETMLVLFSHLLGILLAAGLAAHLAAVLLTDGRALIDQVRGEVDGWWALAAVYSVRLPAVLVLLAIVAALGQTARVAQLEAESRAFWSTAGEAVTLGLAGYRSEAEARSTMAALADLARAQEEAGDLVFASLDDSGDRAVLYVDEGYLARVDVREADGARLTSALEGAVTVLIPKSASAEEEAAADELVRGFLSIQSTISDGVPGTSELPVVRRSGAAQTLTTFRSAQAGLNTRQATVTDPVVVVLPSVSVLAPSEILAFTSTGSLVFTDPESVETEIAARGLREAVAFVEPVAYHAEESYRRALGDVSTNVASLIAGAVVVLLTGLTASVVVVEKDRQRAFVHHVSGLPPLSAHRSALILEALLMAGAAALGTVPLWFRDPRDVRTVLDLAGPDAQLVLLGQSALGIAASAAGSGLLVLCLVLAHQRAARQGALRS